ncbi:chromatin assembly factor 1 subunit A-domain-containing protein [Cokeromyces recurvatus]|uniref:chromatin assembly factor 1 subunit A-domain-containing protein n=1 Tax=Cokeromyces recurvatus TaxID=90255 RepID=UPI00221EE498|nr:chromatin assembly factor 1 subunit A-domain-containing protein [Cokeromyces recurvatus]KAI7903634.1 chromatin assembly factor 1 subunit A-domain-containing protein [Cokeromyces recurvatus]
MNVPNVRLALRMKLLQFSENVRPAYHGTFTQKSRVVNGRKPFAQDNDVLDYEVDSEAEWEPEGEGEDIHSDNEEEEDINSDIIDPEDAGWLVPEGYLSDNEGVEGEHDDDRVIHKSLQYHKSTSKRVAIRKIVLGPFFEGETEEDETMKPFEAQFLLDIPKEGYNPFYKEPVSKISANTTLTTSSNGNTTSATSHNKNEFTEVHTNALISVINEKPLESIPSLITEAKANWILKDVSKRQLEAKIKDIAVKEKRGSDTVS